MFILALLRSGPLLSLLPLASPSVALERSAEVHDHVEVFFFRFRIWRLVLSSDYFLLFWLCLFVLSRLWLSASRLGLL